ncbi:MULTISPECIES: hypothetical protein [unclassified Streptosporangium]|nr:MULTISPECIES: hypothetical protein [unclassified Streptosporangium]
MEETTAILITYARGRNTWSYTPSLVSGTVLVNPYEGSRLLTQDDA